MRIHFGRRVDHDVEGFLLDRVLRDDRPGDGGDAEDVDPGGTRSRRVAGIRTVGGNLIAGDDIVVQELTRSVAVHRHAGRAHYR